MCFRRVIFEKRGISLRRGKKEEVVRLSGGWPRLPSKSKFYGCRIAVKRARGTLHTPGTTLAGYQHHQPEAAGLPATPIPPRPIQRTWSLSSASHLLPPPRLLHSSPSPHTHHLHCTLYIYVYFINALVCATKWPVAILPPLATHLMYTRCIPSLSLFFIIFNYITLSLFRCVISGGVSGQIATANLWLIAWKTFIYNFI